MRSLSATLLAWVCLAVLVPHMVSVRVLAAKESCNNPNAPSEDEATPAAMARSYDKMIGSSQRGARYQFRPEQHYVLEGAQILLDAGITSYKFHLQPEYASGVVADVSKKPMSLLDVLKSSEFPYQKVLDMPFASFQVVIGSHEGVDLLEEEVEWYQQVYDLAVYLIKRYKNSGKTFFLTTDRADFAIRQHTAAQPTPTAATPIDAERQELVGKMWWEHAAAVDDARVDKADEMTGVQVFSSLEVNLMKDDKVDYTAIDDLIPTMDPKPDYVAVSLSTMPQYTSAADPTKNIHELLDHVASKLTPKDGVSGPRVLIGDYGFPLRTADGEKEALTATPELQARRALAVAAAAVSWGTPAINYASLYDSTTTAKNTATARVLADTAAGAGKYQDKGVALVKSDGKDTVFYTALKDYAKQAIAWVEGQVEANGARPCRDEFRQWAAETLVKLANDISPDTKLAGPALANKQGCDKKATISVV